MLSFFTLLQIGVANLIDNNEPPIIKIIMQSYSSSVAQQNANQISTVNAKQILLKEDPDEILEDTTCFKEVEWKKIRVYPEDEAITNKIKATPAKKIGFQKITEKEKDKELNLKQDNSSELSLHLEIPPNKKVEEILKKAPLRQRFAHLLPDNRQLPLSSKQKHLITLMGIIDTTIMYLTSNRASPSIFFTDLRKNISHSLKTTLQKSQLQQLIFIDEDLYDLKWAINDKTKKYDLIITFKGADGDQRKQRFRGKLLRYLQAKQTEFMVGKEIKELHKNKWAPNFDIETIEIPQKDLPIHPNVQKAEIKQVPSSINPHLRQLFIKKQAENDAKSLTSSQVSNLIFAKTPTADIKQKIYKSIQQKQAQMSMQPASAPVSKQLLVDMCDEILLIYLGKRVSNMFKVTLLEKLNEKCNQKRAGNVEQGLEWLLKKGLKFISQTKLSNGSLIIQIEKSKLNEAIEEIKKEFQ